MSSSVVNTYTPPPPEKPSEVSRSALKPINYPVAATPLPPPSLTRSSISSASSSSTVLPDPNTHQHPQIRYCYFISASSVAPAGRSSSGHSSNSTTSSNQQQHHQQKPVYLSPHTQDPSDLSPNCTQPRSRPTKDSSSSNHAFVLGPNPPQIQLGFLEDEPLPSIASESNVSDSTTLTRKTSDTVQVERKDSGYGGSVSRSSSLAAFGRGIRKVFLRNSQKDTVETFVVADPPVIDCDIPQDVLDHEDWAQDLAQRLTLASASAPDSSSVAAWLGQLQTDGTIVPELDLVIDHPAIHHSEETFTFVLNGPEDLDSAADNIIKNNQEGGLDVVEEMVFIIPPTQSNVDDSTLLLPQSKSDSSLLLNQEVQIVTTPVLVYEQSGNNTTTTIRKVVSHEELNKPHPPLPWEALEDKPAPSVPTTEQNQSKSSSSTAAVTSTSPFNSIAKKFTAAAELSFGRNSIKSSSNGKRPNLQDLFTDPRGGETSRPSSPISSSRYSKDRRMSSDDLELISGETSVMGLDSVLMTSPEEINGDSYIGIKSNSKRSNRFFKTLAALTAIDSSKNNYNGNTNKSQQIEIRPLSEVLLSNSDLSPEEISAEIITASRSSSLRSPNTRYANNSSAVSTLRQGKERSSSQPLAPPRPLFYNKGDTSSATSLGEASSCGSESSAIDSSDEWELGHGRMSEHTREQNARYNADLKDLQSLLFQMDDSSNRSSYTPSQSANTSTGSLSIPSVPPSPSRKDNNNNKTFKSLSKKDDYMSHRMSACTPMVVSTTGKTKPRSKSRLSMTYGGGELEVVKHAKFDTPEAIARNKEIRKFISQEIYTTELNYLQYLHTIKEVFVDPLFNSLENDRPFLPRSSPLYQLLAHISGLIAVSTQITQRLGDCVRDEVWSDETSMVGTIFLDAKEPLSNFLKYGQSYGRGMKALRNLMKSKRTTGSVSTMTSSSAAVAVAAATVPPRTSESNDGPTIDKRRSLPAIFALNHPGPMTEQTHGWAGAHSKPRSSHGMLAASGSSSSGENNNNNSDYERFLFNCAGGKETTSRFSLADLLILPIQRVTRYCLLLKDLKKHTDTEHDDYICIVHALEQVHTLAHATNNVQPSSMRM